MEWRRDSSGALVPVGAVPAGIDDLKALERKRWQQLSHEARLEGPVAADNINILDKDGNVRAVAADDIASVFYQRCKISQGDDGTAVDVSANAPLYVAGRNGLLKSLAVSGSIGITTAATWMDQLVWAVPASTVFKPKAARCAVTTAATRTLVLAGKQLATFNPGTNAFAATGSVSGNDFYDRLIYRVATTHSATATTVTITYNDQAGASSTATATVIPSAAPGRNWFELPLASGDYGAQSVTAVSDTAAPTSVVDEVWGFRTLVDDLGPANTPHIVDLGDSVGVPNGESIVILFNAAATTAQQRFASVVGDLVAV